MALNPPPSLYATLSFCTTVSLTYCCACTTTHMLSLFFTALIESLFFCSANCSLAHFLLMYLYSLPSVIWLLADTEVRYLSTMPTLFYSPCIVAYLFLGDLTKSFGYSQTLSIFILSFAT